MGLKEMLSTTGGDWSTIKNPPLPVAVPPSAAMHVTLTEITAAVAKLSTFISRNSWLPASPHLPHTQERHGINAVRSAPLWSSLESDER